MSPYLRPCLRFHLHDERESSWCPESAIGCSLTFRLHRRGAELSHLCSFTVKLEACFVGEIGIVAIAPRRHRGPPGGAGLS